MSHRYEGFQLAVSVKKIRLWTIADVIFSHDLDVSITVGEDESLQFCSSSSRSVFMYFIIVFFFRLVFF